MLFDISQGSIRKYLSQFDKSPLNEKAFSVEFGDDSSFLVGSGEPAFKAKINKPFNKIDLLRSTSLTLGEAYMDRGIEIEGDLFSALNLIMSQKSSFSLNQRAMKKLLHSSIKVKDQKKEVSYHYDIGNDFYKLWLGKTLNYSCAYFRTEEDDLDQAQDNKTDRILQKLQLVPGMSLLDVGCGWGYLLIKAARNYGVHGTGITLSQQQAKEFQGKIKSEGLEDFLEVKIMDYRELSVSELQFDRVVSVGMIEHVGRENYNLFLSNIDSILKPKGLFLLHFISSMKESPGDPWIRKYIFPGGMIPSLREIVHQCVEHGFPVLDVESMRRHYEKTLLCWYENFKQELDTITTMFDERFIRMWELYLVSCAASFRNGELDLHQLLLSKGPNNELPLTRPY